MINQQLVDYIKQQLQAGVSKDVVRKALVDAGWPVPDIDDSMKAGEPAASPTVTATAVASTAQPTINPAVAMGGVDVSSRPSAIASAAKGGASGDKFFAQSSSIQAKHDDDEHPHVKKFIVTMIVMAVIIVLLAGALGYLYFGMSGQAGNTQQSAADLTTLQGEVQQLTTSNSNLMAQMSSLTATTTELMDELSFFAMPMPTATASSSSTSTPAQAPVTATIQGVLTGTGTQPFVLTTIYNVQIFVANYKDATVKAALLPLANGTTTVQLTGTHVPESPNLTVTAVNGSPV